MAHGISDEDPTKKERFDSPEELDNKIEQLADWIRNAKHFIVFTGSIKAENREKNKIFCFYVRSRYFDIDRVRFTFMIYLVVLCPFSFSFTRKISMKH